MSQNAAHRPVSEKPTARDLFKSKLERSYASYLELQKVAGEIRNWRYEPVTLKLADGVRYTPDFHIEHMDGREEWHEVKGYHKGLQARPGVIKLKVAASHWPRWTFVLVTRYRGVWDLRELPL